MFAYSLGWTDGDMVCMGPEPHAAARRGLLQLCMYARHLATGNSLMCKSIRCDTIKEYICAASTFLALFDNQRDFRFARYGDTKFAPELQAIYNEISRWESVKNR